MEQTLQQIIQDSLGENAEVVTQPQDLELEPSSMKGMWRSLRSDIANSGALLSLIAAHHFKQRFKKLLKRPRKASPANDEAAILLAPGYFGPNAYLKPIAKTTNLPIIRHPHFDRIRLVGDLEEESQLYYEVLKQREAPTVIVGHSRGGPTILKALKHLQDAEEDDVVEVVILIAPISHGVREEVAQVIKHVPFGTFQEMCPGSPELESWQGLNEKNRAKIIIISTQDGDMFTSKERGFVDGSTLVLIDCDDGHLQQCIDPQSVMFQTVIAIANAVGKEISGRPKRI
jgi:hypothetical protein